jgi:hypothetical protein
MQLATDGHETPYMVSLVPACVGDTSIFQCAPSQRSIRTRVVVEGVRDDVPAAVHTTEPEGQEIDDRALISVPAGFGVDSTCQPRGVPCAIGDLV